MTDPTPITHHDIPISEAISTLNSYYERIPEMVIAMRVELTKNEFEKFFNMMRYERRIVADKIKELYLLYYDMQIVKRQMSRRDVFGVGC